MGTPAPIRALFAVDGCSVSFTLRLLADQPVEGCLYVISYAVDDFDGDPLLAPRRGDGDDDGDDAEERSRGPTGGDGPSSRASPPEEDSSFMAEDASPPRLYRPGEARTVQFCLLNQMTSGKGGADIKARVRAAFVCRFADAAGLAALRASLTRGEPLTAETVRAALDDEATFALHDRFNLALCVALLAGSGGAARDASHTKARERGRRPARRAAARGREGSPADESALPPTLRATVRGFRGGRRALAALYLQHEYRVIAAYRRAFGGSTNAAFWYVSKFGPDERSLVLAARYYLLQALRDGEDPAAPGACYDLQAVKDVCLTYRVEAPPNPTGLGPADLTTIARLSRFCCSSGYARGPVASGFPRYVARRVAADLAEVGALRGFIERDRSGLKISDGEFVKYVYLAHFECYNREQLGRHLAAVTVTAPDESPVGRSRLGARAVEEFFTHVRAQLNIEDYVRANVRPEVTALPAPLAEAYCAARAYPAAATRRDGAAVGVYECASQMARHLARLEEALETRGWPRPPAAGGCWMGPPAAKRPALDAPLPAAADGGVGAAGNGAPGQCYPQATAMQGPLIVRRLLALASADAAEGAPSPAALLTGAEGLRAPPPVYRTAMAGGRQGFGATASDAWRRSVPDPARAAAAAAAVLAARRDKTAAVGGEALDSLLTREVARRLAGDLSDPTRVAGGPVGDQKYVNRNEIFNDNLVVGHVILDVDMHLREPIPRLALHAAMRGLRAGALTALRLTMPEAEVDWEAHPCYFYKSECPRRGAAPPETGDWGAGLEQSERLESAWAAGAAEAGGWAEDPSTSFDAELARFLEDSALWESLASSSSSPGPPPASPSSSGVSSASGSGGAASFSLGVVAATAAGETTPDGDAEDRAPCGCERKIGVRVCVPAPRPYALAGARTISGLARLIQQATLLERAFVEAAGAYLKDYDLLDVGVYGHGRSLRMPFFSKIADDGSVGCRFTPFYVTPPRCEDVPAFVAAHFEPRNFHFHALPEDNPRPRLVLNGLGGEYVSFFDRKAAVNRDRFFGHRPSLEAALRERGVEAGDAASVEAFVTECVLDGIGPYVDAHFPEQAREYKNVTVRARVLRDDWVLLQLLPPRSFGSRQGFSCIRYRHGRAASRESVRTFLALSVDAHGRLCASVSQQCFAAKCGNNKLRTLFTVGVGGETAL